LTVERHNLLVEGIEIIGAVLTAPSVLKAGKQPPRSTDWLCLAAAPTFAIMTPWPPNAGRFAASLAASSGSAAARRI
jgi:hypothetical protein